MNRYLILITTLILLALLLSACGPRNVDQAQPIKFEYIRSEVVAGLLSPAHDFRPLSAPRISLPASRGRAA